MDLSSSGAVGSDGEQHRAPPRPAPQPKRRRISADTAVWAAVLGDRRCECPKDATDLLVTIEADRPCDGEGNKTVLVDFVELEWCVPARVAADSQPVAPMQCFGNVAQRRTSLFYL